MKKAFVIIVNYNDGDKILSCLDSIEQEGASVIVVDNNSTDGSVKSIKKRTVRLIRNKENLGFASAVNIGIKYALKRGSATIILLNPDATVKKGFLESLIRSDADIVAPIIAFKRKKKMVYDLGGRVNFILGRSYHQESEKIYHPEVIDYVSGCCMRIGSNVFKKIGLFDERFFLYWEDVDFCLRAKKAGFTVGVELKSQIIHKLEGITNKPWYSVYHFLRSNLLFINRYAFIWSKPLAYFYWLGLSVKIILTKLLCSRE